jgi:hypothetical protein
MIALGALSLAGCAALLDIPDDRYTLVGFPPLDGGPDTSLDAPEPEAPEGLDAAPDANEAAPDARPDAAPDAKDAALDADDDG